MNIVRELGRCKRCQRAYTDFLTKSKRLHHYTAYTEKIDRGVKKQKPSFGACFNVSVARVSIFSFLGVIGVSNIRSASAAATV
jgi:hypothetical protein